MVRKEEMAEGGSLPQVPVGSRFEANAGIETWPNLRSKFTALSYWRRGLIEVLKENQFDEAEGKKCIHFILSIFRFAILSARENGPGGDVRILNNLAPTHLNLVSWRRILVGMNLVLEEPDTNSDIRLIGVSLPTRIKIESYEEFTRLMVILKDCHWHTLHTILAMPEGYQLALLEILNFCFINGHVDDTKRKNIRILYELDQFGMRQLGFYRANPSEPVTWYRPESDVHLTFISILNGLYGPKIRETPQPHSFHSLPTYVRNT